MKSSDFSAAEVQRMIDRANRDTGREPTDVDVAAAHGHLNRGAGFGGSELGQLVRAEARMILTERARAASMPALKKLLDEGGLTVPERQPIEWISINEAPARAPQIPGLIFGADFQARPTGNKRAEQGDDERPLWHHATEFPFRAACGADKPNQGTTTVPENVTCPACRAMLTQPAPAAPPDPIRPALDALLRFVLGCPQGERWMGCQTWAAVRVRADLFRGDGAKQRDAAGVRRDAEVVAALLNSVPGASTNRWLSVDEQREYEALRVALLRAVRA